MAETQNVSISPELLALLRCPITLQPLGMASAAVLARISPPLEAALIREDHVILYPVRAGIPILLAEEAIPNSLRDG